MATAFALVPAMAFEAIETLGCTEAVALELISDAPGTSELTSNFLLL